MKRSLPGLNHEAVLILSKDYDGDPLIIINTRTQSVWRSKKKKTYKLESYNSVSPYCVVNGAQQIVDLLKKLFNAKEKRRYDMPDGTIMHTEVQVDDSIIMIGEASEQFPANTHMMHVYVPNADEIFEKNPEPEL